ncbi:hypothetical protein GUITHDRAFT_46972, partial [Guillardia theta CCMP2712]
RRMLTGRTDTRVRDYVKVPRVIRTLDKYSFTFGVLGITLTEYVMLCRPESFRWYYAMIMSPLLVMRWVMYRQVKWQYFLIDFCYWVNGLCFLVIAGPWSRSPILWQTLFISANGPLLIAILAWRNSFVFHSVDKVTSVYIHLFPSLFTWCERWHGDEAAKQPMTLDGWLMSPLKFYMLWQIFYLVQTEVIDRKKLDDDPTIKTSLRWLAQDKRSAPNKIALKLCRSMRIMDDKESFDHHNFKTKVVFVAMQLLYTILCFLPTGLVYQSFFLHSALIIFIFAASVWNGANYYIDVFSKSFESKYA